MTKSRGVVMVYIYARHGGTHDETDSEKCKVVVMEDDGLQAGSSFFHERPLERRVVAAEPQPD